MNLLYLEVSVIGLCLAFLFYLSLIEAAITQASPLPLRMLLEKKDPAPRLLLLVLENKMELIVPLHLGTQLSLITIAILTAHLSLEKWQTWGIGYSFVIIFLISAIFRQLLPRLLTQAAPERRLVSLLSTAEPIYTLLHSLALPLSSVLGLFKRLHADIGTTATQPAGESTEEEIQAYLEIGEDEGILQKEDTQLIHSVVQFGDTLVRDVMTPRTKIIACELNASVMELRDIMVRHRHSRIPIYRGDIDHIVGVAYIRQLLAEYSRGREGNSVEALVRPALFIPETKPVAALLRELQERGDHTAIVIDEFGGVAGLVTIEDLVEEIVGEIRDEDQANVSEVVEENSTTYLLRGSTEIHRLEELAGKSFDNVDCSTVAGLILDYLGRVPAPGEEFELEGLRVQVVDADRRRLHRVRIQLPAAAKEASGSDKTKQAADRT